MPYLDGGAVTEARRLIADNVKSLAEEVRQGWEIVVPGPTCSYMLKQEYPWLDGSEDANLVAAHTATSSSTSPYCTIRGGSTRVSPTRPASSPTGYPAI